MDSKFVSYIQPGIPLADASSFYISVKHAEATDPPDMTGLLEGQFKAPVEAVIAALLAQVKREFETMYAYKVYAQTLRDLNHDSIAEHFGAHADDELEHSEYLLKRIAVLGGPAHAPDISAPHPSSDTLDIIKTMIRMEQEGISGWRSILGILGDNPMKVTVESYMAMEQEHLDDLWQLLPHTARPTLDQPKEAGYVTREAVNIGADHAHWMKNKPKAADKVWERAKQLFTGEHAKNLSDHTVRGAIRHDDFRRYADENPLRYRQYAHIDKNYTEGLKELQHAKQVEDAKVLGTRAGAGLAAVGATAGAAKLLRGKKKDTEEKSTEEKSAQDVSLKDKFTGAINKLLHPKQLNTAPGIVLTSEMDPTGVRRGNDLDKKFVNGDSLKHAEDSQSHDLPKEYALKGVRAGALVGGASAGLTGLTHGNLRDAGIYGLAGTAIGSALGGLGGYAYGHIAKHRDTHNGDSLKHAQLRMKLAFEQLAAGPSPELQQYMQAEDVGQQAQHEQEVQYYQGQAQQAQQENEQLQAQLSQVQQQTSELQQQVQQSQEQLSQMTQQSQQVQQVAMQSATQANQLAAQANIQHLQAQQDALMHKQLSANLRAGVAQMKEQLSQSLQSAQQALMSDPTMGVETQLASGAQPAQPQMDPAQAQQAPQEEQPQQADPNAQQAQAQPAKTASMAGDVANNFKDIGSSVLKSKIDWAKHNGPYAALGAAFGAGVQRLTYNPEDTLKVRAKLQELEDRQAQQPSFANATRIAKQKMLLSFHELEDSNPNRATIAAGLMGGSAIGAAGPVVADGAKRLVKAVAASMRHHKAVRP